MDLKSTLQVFNEADINANPGVTEGQTQKRLIGFPEHPSERIRMIIASYKAESLEELHWHPIETLAFVVSGRAIVRDIEGKSHPVGPGSVVYAPAGISGSHEWDIQEPLQLVAVRATTDLERGLQFTVDKKTLASTIELDELLKRGGAHFKSLY
jgi:mannose-6-phosphate isomerase-like protein (cupin superfamily)